MRKNAKKLILNKDTVRALQDSELRQVAGGRKKKAIIILAPEQTLYCPTNWHWRCVPIDP